MKRSQSTRGMTLTEVIVVIIVIAILIGVLLPQIARVKFEARQSLLKNNMRRMALGSFSEPGLERFKAARPDCEVIIESPSE